MRRAETIMRNLAEPVAPRKSEPTYLWRTLSAEQQDRIAREAADRLLELAKDPAMVRMKDARPERYRDLMLLAARKLAPKVPAVREMRLTAGAFAPIRAVACQRRASRAPRRVGRPAAKRTAQPTAEPAPEPPPRPSGQRPVTAQPPIGGIVTDVSGFADLTPRTFRETVKRRGIPYATLGRRMLVRLDDLLRALGLEPRVDSAPPVETREGARLRLVAELASGTRKVGAR